ncbi:11532_t:CDS:1, partial [Gigaspora rosea]
CAYQIVRSMKEILNYFRNHQIILAILLQILKDLGQAYELNEVMIINKNLMTNNKKNLDQNLKDIIYDLFLNNELITYDENGCIDICSDSQDLSE